MLWGSARQGVCVCATCCLYVSGEGLTFRHCYMCPATPVHTLPSYKCLHPVSVISQEGNAFSAFVQVHNALCRSV